MRMIIIGWRLLWGSLLAVTPTVSQAMCLFDNDILTEINQNISFGHVNVPWNMPVGSVIATTVTGAYYGGGSIITCPRGDAVYRWELAQWHTESFAGSNIYETNLTGVGLRITNTDSGLSVPYNVNLISPANVAIPGDGMRVELIKTGDITGGTLTAGVLGRALIAGQFYFASITLNGINTVTAAPCSITTPQINVQLGRHDKSEFSGPGSGTDDWRHFDVGLDCDHTSRIYVRIDAVKDASYGSQGVMRLDSAPGDSGASGVGIQIRYRPDDSAVQYGQPYFYQQATTGANSIQLKARYYQVSSPVIPGVANGTASLTLTYK